MKLVISCVKNLKLITIKKYQLNRIKLSIIADYKVNQSKKR